jgi:hypothetical protein
MAVIDPERQFIESARQHGFYTHEGNPRATNKAHDRVVAAREGLRARPDKGRQFLSACLADDDPAVATWAAFYLLPFRDAEAIETLERVARSDVGPVAFDAEMTLKEWRAGRLKIE